jgi:adenine-specific DNA-methyltransferase
MYETDWLKNEADLIGAALALGARTVPGWSEEEEQLALKGATSRLNKRSTDGLIREIQSGHDPLGSAFSQIRSPQCRRPLGATYTPEAIVSAMVRWAERQDAAPVRIIDAGAGSARFLLAAGGRLKCSQLIGVELDALAAMLARANLAACGFAARSLVLVENYLSTVLTPTAGATLFIGNPPYVRHHQIPLNWKIWLRSKAKQLGYDASQLSGMHVYFFLATALKSRPGDFGVFVTAAEWLDVNYGRLLRELFLNELGGTSLTVIEPTAQPFEGTAATAAVATFQIGSRLQRIGVSRVAATKMLVDLSGGQQIHRGRLESQVRWSHLMRTRQPIPGGFVELGELCRVHRGQVTGANDVWIAGEHSQSLPSSVLFRTVTRARELFRADGVLRDSACLRDVIDLPADLDSLAEDDKRTVLRFLRYAKEAGAASGYIARNRKAWWCVGLRSPAPVLATYMARRPPAFVRNLVGARHLNIAHGLYPREELSAATLDSLAKFLSAGVSVSEGRTYAGGLTKFEPREMERLIVPSPALLQSTVSQ